MAEIALRTSERLARIGNIWHWRPVGSTIICCTDLHIRRKWLEICCDLVAPYKRNKYKSLPGWDRLCEAWTPKLREAWLEFDRPTEKNKLSPLLEDEAFLNSVWQTMIEPTGVLADLPFAPDSDRKVCDTWLWSEFERKNYFIVHNANANHETIQSWQGVDERNAETGILLTVGDLAAIKLAKDLGAVSSIKLAYIWKKQINYKIDLGLSGGTLDDIANPDKTLHPRFDKPVVASKAVQPDISKLSVVRK